MSKAKVSCAGSAPTQAETQTTPEIVALADLTFDVEYQLRAAPPSTDEYAELLTEKPDVWPFPPLTVYRIGAELLVVEGFTRGAAAKSVGLESVPCTIVDGTYDDAIRHAIGSNSTHGYRRTRADVRKAVERAATEWPSLSHREIARRCRTSHATVNRTLGAGCGPRKRRETVAATLSLEICPVCGIDDWAAMDDGGYECIGCKYIYGESPGTDEDEQTALEQQQAVQSAPVDARPINRDAEAVTLAMRDYGRLLRSLGKAGLSDGLKGPLQTIHKCIWDRKRATR